MGTPSVHLRGHVAVSFGLGRIALLGGAQSLRIRRNSALNSSSCFSQQSGIACASESMGTHHQHVVRFGVLQNRVDRLKPGDERLGLGLGDLFPGVSNNFREIGLGAVFLRLGRIGLDPLMLPPFASRVASSRRRSVC
jgi:hypothetical protein